MEAIKIEVTGNIAKVIEKPLRITAGTVGLPVEFVFDSHWDNMTKVAVFNTGIVKKNMKIVDNATVVPIEALAVPELNLSIGVYGVSEDGSVATPTVWASVGQIRHGAVPGSSFGSDIGTAKKYYDLGEQAAEKADASAKKAESEASVAENAADRANASAKSAEASAALAGEEAEHAIIECTQQKNAAINARHYAEEAADRAEAAADRAESAGGGETIIVGIDEGEHATHTAAEIYNAIQNNQSVVFRYDPRLDPSEFIPLKRSTPTLAVFSKTGYPTEFDIFDITIGAHGIVHYEASFSFELVKQAVEKVETDIAPVSYLPQELNPEQQAQAQMNIGVDKLCPPFAGSGSAVTCEPVEGYPLQVVSRIEPVQSGTGDPSPDNIRPISGHSAVKLTQCGKNLLSYPYADISKTEGGITFTDNGDGSITLNGTATSSYLQYALQLNAFADVLKDGVTYRLSTGTDDTNIVMVCYYKNENGESRWASGNLAWKKEYTLVQIYLQVTEVATYTNMVLYPQIEIGTTATAFEPYRGYTYTMDLGQEVFGGFLNWTTGMLTDSEGNVHQLNAQEITALHGTNILYSNTGDTEVTGRADPAAIINDLENRLAALEAAIVNNA